MGIIGTVEEVGLNAATGGVGGTALRLVKTYWKPALIIIACLVIAGAAIGHLANDKHTRRERDGLKAWQGAVVKVVEAEVPAKGRAKITSSTAVENIEWLGQELRTTRKALDDQSAALRVAQQQANAATSGYHQALQQAARRDQARDVTRRALRDPKRTTGLTEAEWGKL